MWRAYVFILIMDAFEINLVLAVDIPFDPSETWLRVFLLPFPRPTVVYLPTYNTLYVAKRGMHLL